MAHDPFLQHNPLVASLEQHRGRIEQTRENTARQAWAYGTVTTNGSGSSQLTTVLPFNVTFIERPMVSTGYSTTADLAVDDFPLVTAGVWRWWQDSRGFYLGAYVFFYIESGVSYGLIHDFTFSGVALKDLPDYLL